MNYDQWWELFKPYRTRAEIRKALSSQMKALLGSGRDRALPDQILHLAAGSDCEVLESFDILQRICSELKGEKRRSVAGAISMDLCELFATALEKMNRLPAEGQPIRLASK